jgi:hypothetical protein
VNIACFVLKQSVKGKNSQKGPPLLPEWRAGGQSGSYTATAYADCVENLSVSCSPCSLHTSSQQLGC